MELKPEDFKNFIYISLISADNESYEEDIKQDLIKRYKEHPKDWSYIFDILPDKDKILDLFEAYDEQYDRKPQHDVVSTPETVVGEDTEMDSEMSESESA